MHIHQSLVGETTDRGIKPAPNDPDFFLLSQCQAKKLMAISAAHGLYTVRRSFN